MPRCPKISSVFSCVLLTLTITGVAATAAAQAPTVNGLFYGDGDFQRYGAPYATSAYGSNLYVTLVDKVLFVALVVDRRVNDNVFSPVQNYRRNAGWQPPRTANRLYDSEFAAFTLTVGDGPSAQTWSWRQGYAGVATGVESYTNNTWYSGTDVSGGTPMVGPAPLPNVVMASSLAWNMNNYAARFAAGNHTWNMGTAATPSSWTSPITNPLDPTVVINPAEGYPGPSGLPPAGSAAITYSPTHEWEWPMVYEWSLDLSSFAQIPTFVVAGESHHSPSKLGPEDDIFDPPTTPQPLLDLGDLPDSYLTTVASNGARHALDPNGVRLGIQLDSEANGQPGSQALGDDALTVGDEDGVSFLTPVLPGRPARVRVTTSNAAGFLSAFMDFDTDGTVSPVTVLSATGPASVATGTLGDTLFATPGVYELVIDVPSNATGTMPSRWRVASASGLGANSMTGQVTGGEVEDYMLASVGNLVWLDENMNGLYEPGLGETGADGVLVSLLNADGSPVVDGDGNPVTTSTDLNGTYSFPGLPVGRSYRLALLPPTGFAVSPQNADGQGINGPSNSDFNTATFQTEIFTLTQGQTNLNLDAGVHIDPFLAVDLLSLDAVLSSSGTSVEVVWTTGAELDNAGFHIYRALSSANGGWTAGERLTGSLIPSQATQAAGASYVFVDPLPVVAGSPDQRSYLLEEIDLSGASSFHGPAVWTASSPNSSVTTWPLY